MFRLYSGRGRTAASGTAVAGVVLGRSSLARALLTMRSRPPRRSWPSDEPDATPAFCDVTGFTKLRWIFHFAQRARNEIYAPSQQPGFQRADRVQSDMVGLDF